MVGAEAVAAPSFSKECVAYGRVRIPKAAADVMWKLEICHSVAACWHNVFTSQ